MFVRALAGDVFHRRPLTGRGHFKNEVLSAGDLIFASTFRAQTALVPFDCLGQRGA